MLLQELNYTSVHLAPAVFEQVHVGLNIDQRGEDTVDVLYQIQIILDVSSVKLEIRNNDQWNLCHDIL